MMSWIGAYILTTLVLFFAQGFLLQVSVALTGEPAPRFGRALKTSLLAGFLSFIATAAFGLTIGLVIGKSLYAVTAGLLAVGITTLVYRRQLGSSVLQAFMVALIQYVLSAVLSLFTWNVVGWLF
jgi:hypothetical protein